MPAKKRKATNTVRREEAEALKKEITVLQSQVQELQAQKPMTTRDHLQLLGYSIQTKIVLQELLEDQELVFAGAQSQLLNCQEKETMNPLYTYIHLPKCCAKRRQILMDLKDEKLDSAVKYLHARSQNLNLLRRHSSENRYEDADGVFCCNRFEVNHVTGVKSLKEVYEAIKFFFTNVEISTSEALGNVTVREDYDTIGDDESISSFRLICHRPSGITWEPIVTESNKVLYDKYYDHHELMEGRPCAVVFTDSVDKDDLHPYDPKSRVRLDVSAAFLMTEVKQNKLKSRMQDKLHAAQSKSPVQDENDEEEFMVVIQSVIFVKALNPEINVSAHALNTVGDGTASWIKVMLQTVREFVDAL